MKNGKQRNLADVFIKLWREQSVRGIPVHAAGAGYFIVLSAFPMLVLLLGLLRYTGLSVHTLNDFLEGLIPQALWYPAKRLVVSAYRNTSGMVISISALVALWSAGRGVYGLIQGLNAVYHRQETRSWLRVRLLSTLYTGVFLAVVLATLIVSVFGTALIQWLPANAVLTALDQWAGLRLGILLLLQTGLFCGMFMALPNGGNRFWPSLPGALMASIGWLLFSELYSRYVTHFAGYANIFGSVYGVALSMLWLYICLRILFFAGAWNESLGEK